MHVYFRSRKWTGTSQTTLYFLLLLDFQLVFLNRLQRRKFSIRFFLIFFENCLPILSHIKIIKVESCVSSIHNGTVRNGVRNLSCLRYCSIYDSCRAKSTVVMVLGWADLGLQGYSGALFSFTVNRVGVYTHDSLFERPVTMAFLSPLLCLSTNIMN